MSESNSIFQAKKVKRTHQQMLEQQPYSILEKIDKSLPPIVDFQPSLKLSGPIFQEIILHHSDNMKKCADFVSKKTTKKDNEKSEVKNPFSENLKNSNIFSNNINEKSNPFNIENSLNNPFLSKSNDSNPFLTNNNFNFTNTKEEKQKNDIIINPFANNNSTVYNPFTQTNFIISNNSNKNPFETNNSNIINPFTGVGININSSTIEKNPFCENKNNNQEINDDENDFNIEEEVKIEKDDSKLEKFKKIEIQNDQKFYEIPVQNCQYLDIVNGKAKFISIGESLFSLQQYKNEKGIFGQMVAREPHTKTIKLQGVFNENTKIEKVQLSAGLTIIVYKDILTTFSKDGSNKITKKSNIRVKVGNEKNLEELFEASKQFMDMIK